MKKKTIILLVSGLLLCGSALWAHDYGITEKEAVRQNLAFSQPAGSKSLIIDNVFGFIRVRGYSGQEVRIQGEKTIRAATAADVQKAKREVKMELAEKENTVRLYVDGPFRCHDGSVRWDDSGYIVQYDLELQVPFQVALNLKTVNDGDILVQDVQGDFVVRNVNDKIAMRNVSGSGQAHTVNGDITVIFRADPAAACSFHTVNGDVKTVFSKSLSADFFLKTMNGEMYSDFPFNMLPPQLAAKQKENGAFIYKSNRAQGIRIGRGGNKIEVETLNGDIIISNDEKKL